MSWVRRSLLVTLSFAGMGLVGCRATQLQYDQDQFRCRLMQMYTDQIMDNLIRCYEGMPFVQLDYSKITGTVTQEADGNLGGHQESTNAGVYNLPAKTLQLTRQLVNHLDYGLKGSQVNQLTVTADPVVNDATVYRAYLEFLSKPGRLVVSCDGPPPGSALIERPRGKVHYWVPAAYRDDFRELALRTTALRGEVVEAPEAWETTVTGVTDVRLGNRMPPDPKKPLRWQQYMMVIHLDPKIPNDSGVIREVALAGRLYNFKVGPYIEEEGDDDGPKPIPDADPPKKDPGVERPAVDTGRDRLVSGPAREIPRTDKLVLTYIYDARPPDQITDKDIARGHVPMSVADLADKLAKQKVKIRLDRFRPTIAPTKDLLRSIDHQMELFRLNQQIRLTP